VIRTAAAGHFPGAMTDVTAERVQEGGVRLGEAVN